MAETVETLLYLHGQPLNVVPDALITDKIQDACIIHSCMSANSETFGRLHAFLSRAFCVMSRIPDSKDTSGDDGEGEESVQGVFAQQILLPPRNVLSLPFTGVGLLWNRKRHQT